MFFLIHKWLVHGMVCWVYHCFATGASLTIMETSTVPILNPNALGLIMNPGCGWFGTGFTFIPSKAYGAPFFFVCGEGHPNARLAATQG